MDEALVDARSCLCGTESKAFLKSKKTVATSFPASR